MSSPTSDVIYAPLDWGVRGWGIVAVVFGASGFAPWPHANFWTHVGSALIIIIGIPLCFIYKQTTVDLSQRRWIRTSRRVFSVETETGSIDDVVELRVREVVGQGYWLVTLRTANGQPVHWYLYPGIRHGRMESDVDRLQTALNVPVVMTAE